MEIRVETEVMNDVFTKYHIIGLPFDLVLHHFTGVEKDAIHDHPYRFTSHIIRGSYIEKQYQIDGEGVVGSIKIPRVEGEVHIVEATDIHEITDLPEGDCWTLILPEKKVRESGFWKFDGEIFFRKWYEKLFKPYKP